QRAYGGGEDDEEEIEPALARGEPGEGDDELGGNRREYGLEQHQQHDAEIAEIGDGVGDPGGHAFSPWSGGTGRHHNLASAPPGGPRRKRRETPRPPRHDNRSV